jgi:hypothetical protein
LLALALARDRRGQLRIGYGERILKKAGFARSRRRKSRGDCQNNTSGDRGKQAATPSKRNLPYLGQRCQPPTRSRRDRTDSRPAPLIPRDAKSHRMKNDIH